MSVSAIQTAFMADFAAMTLSGFTKVYPNLPFTGVLPYVDMQFIHADAQPVGLAAASGKTLLGSIMFTVVTELGKGLAQAASASDLIVARYPFQKVLTVSGGGRIEIPSPPQVMEGFRQDHDWRTPIRVQYRGFF